MIKQQFMSSNRTKKNIVSKAGITILALGLALSQQACNSTKKALVTEETKPVASKETLHAEDFLNKNISWNTFNGKAGLHYENKDQNQDLTCNMRMQKDKDIWASFVALGIIEAARAKVTPDSLKAINKINKEGYALSYKEGQELIGTQVDFSVMQNLFIGNPLITNVPVSKFETQDSTVSITQSKDGFTQVLTYNRSNSTLKELRLSAAEKQFDCTILFDNYKAITLQQPFAFNRNITIHNKGQEIKLTLEFSKAELDVPVETNFNIPSNYTMKPLSPKK